MHWKFQVKFHLATVLNFYLSEFIHMYVIGKKKNIPKDNLFNIYLKVKGIFGAFNLILLHLAN